ncbi:WD repeat-containing protein 52 [Gryllus bimaculatus]|nr:WD repeat-containing protein 52 [Gryllus bimaculatus]
MSETDLEPTTEDEGGKESETPGEIVEDDEGGDENEQRERDANEELGEQEEDYEEKEGDEYEDEEYGEEEKEGEGGKVIKKAGLKVLDKKDVVHDENEEEVSEEEDIYAERKEGELRAELRAEKRMSLQVDDDDEDDEEYEDEEEEDYISGPYLSLDSTKNPNPKYPHVAVAEKGLNPLIIIYEWPSMEHIRVLRGGAKRAFACLHYSPDGRFLCSQGCEPDYFLTVWNWKKGRILRQQKAYGQDVFNAMFSDYSLGNLTTAGYGHIKFWKLAKTFTGLKLMGKIGRFGKTEMCDIIGFIALPDEQVVSGCEWGNMLIWNEGLVKAEVCRKAGASCHEGYISQLLYDDKDEEIISIGTDGFIRAWDFKLIEKADLVGDSPKIKIENLYALEVGKGYDKASLLYIEKQDNTNPEKSLWFAQDHPLAPEKVFRCHAGGVRSVAACPYDTYVASYGDDGRLLFYNYATRRVVLAHKFAAGGGFLVWLDTSVEPTGDVVVCGGADGLVRVAVVALQNREAAGEAARDDDFLCLVQTTKPHTMRITSMAVREAQGLLVTGSEDATIFVYQILPRHDYVSLNPIGFVNVPSAVTHLTWKPHEDKPMILVSCFGGQAVLMEIPDAPQVDTKVSYELKNIPQKEIVFLSVKSQLRRDFILEQDAIRRAEKLEMKKEKLKAMREENPNLKIDEDLFYEDSESSITLESLYFPEVPNPILFSLYLTDDIIWMSPAGYDAGYMYEYLADMEDPIRCTLIADADDIEIHSYVEDPTGEFLILGMQDGKIRVCRKNPNNISDLSDYWALSMHDNDNGIIPQMCFSYDNKFMFSCGRDGNVFAYVVASEIDKPPIRKPKKSAPWPSDSLEDITDPEMYSLEQLKQKAEYDRKMKLANDHKQEVLESLQKLKEKFASVAQSNKTLPLKLRIPYGEFKIDHRIEDDLEDELEDMLALEKRKLAHQAEKSSIALQKLQDYYYNVLDTHLVTVRAFKNPKLKAYTFRSRALGPEFQQAKRFVKEKLDRADKLQRPAGIRGSKFAPSTTIKHRLRLGTWLKGIGSVGTNIRMNVKLQRMLLKYYERKRAKELREEQWNRMTTMKPDPKVSHPDDVAAMEQAERTIGDFKMKTDPNFTVYQIQKNYNDRVLQLRDKKVALINHINELNERLTKRHKELPSSDIILPPPIPEVLKEEEFPERELTLQEEDVLAYYPTPPPSASTRAASASAEDGLEEAHKPSLARAQVRLLRIHSPVTVSSATGLSPGSFINYFVCSVN